MNREEFFGDFLEYRAETLGGTSGIYVSAGLTSIYFSPEDAQKLVEILSRHLQENPG